MSVLLLCMFLHYQHDGFNIFLSLILRWVLLLNFCRWVKLSNQLPLYGIGSFCPDLAILAVSTQEIFLPLPLLLLPLISLLPVATLSIEMTLSLTLPLVQSIFCIFKKQKLTSLCQVMIPGVSLNHFLFFYPTCAFYTRLARGWP